MNALRRIGTVGGALIAALAAALVTVATGTAPAPAQTLASTAVPACGSAPAGFARCLTWYVPGSHPARAAGTTPAGWGATDLAAAYRLPVSQSASATVAISIAYDSPTLEADLNTYRQQYGLPACTTANGCFRKVNQTGAASPLPASQFGWGVEEHLDVSMVSAACPHCRILVVEGNSASSADLAATENTAVALGAQVVSNSYGLRENGQAMTFAPAYHHPGHTIVVSSGDNGFGAASFPANLSTVTAVGGTNLARANNARGWAETAWSFSSSGCSAYVAKPSWQHDKDCSMRTTADVAAAAADIAVYDQDLGGWTTVAGTSASAPLVAGIYGLAGNAGKVGAAYAYQHVGGLYDVTSGSNDLSGEQGGACGNDYLCVATTGYDGPTGLGTPNGTTAF